MKKTTFLSLAIVVIISAVIALQTYKEASAENQDVSVTVTIYEYSREYHGPYTAELINLTTHEITQLSMNLDKFSVPPSIRGGSRPTPGTADNFIIHVCTSSGASGVTYGANSAPFHITGSHTNINVTVSPGCPAVPLFNE